MGAVATGGTAYRRSARALRRAGKMSYEVGEESIQDEGRGPSSNRVSAYEAAEVLGITVDAIRKRIQRGTIPHERGDDGRVWVLLKASGILPDEEQDNCRTKSDELLAELREQVRYLREILGEEQDARKRADTIIAQLAQVSSALAARVSKLEALPEEPADHPRPSSDAEGDSESRERSSWRRLFEG